MFKGFFNHHHAPFLCGGGNESSQASYPGTSHLFLLGAQLNHFAPACGDESVDGTSVGDSKVGVPCVPMTLVSDIGTFKKYHAK